MFRTLDRLGRRDHCGTRRRTAQPCLERLEDRQLLYSTLGGQWTYPVRVTYSFVPDGTNVDGLSSNLFSTLNTIAPTATWEAAIEQAAAAWSASANINLTLVPDNGSPIGAAGNQQDDPRFGDIRISMVPQQAGVLGFAMSPPPINGDSSAGDIVFSSSVYWGIGNSYDLETVALHEFGHALGLDHSSLSTADMYAYYTYMKQTPTSDDVAGVQALYGPPPVDTARYATSAGALNLTGTLNGSGQTVIGYPRIEGPSDSNWFYVTAPANTTGTMTVSMQSTNLSSLSPAVSIYNSSLRWLTGNGLPGVYGGTATTSITGVTPGQSFYIQAAASSGGTYGDYALLVNFGSLPQPPAAPPSTVVASQPDGYGSGASFERSDAMTVSPSLTAPAHPEPVPVSPALDHGSSAPVVPTSTTATVVANLNPGTAPHGPEAHALTPTTRPTVILARTRPALRVVDTAQSHWDVTKHETSRPRHRFR